MVVEMEQFQDELIDRVFDRGICVRCGACVGLCPYFRYFDGIVAVMDRCVAGTGRCVQVCPRAGYKATAPQENDPDGRGIGIYRSVFKARALVDALHEGVQYGGVVTALLAYGMESGLFGGAVVTDRGGEFAPSGRLAESVSDVMGCAGSRYSAAGSLAVLNKAIKDGKGNLAVVGLPCQMEALERMKHSIPDGAQRESAVSLRIGIFCTWALDYRMLRDFLHANGVTGAVRKYDIPPPPSEKFVLFTEEGRREFPLREIRGLVQKGCSLCRDMTAENADISIGTVEGDERWNTVVLRSEKGEAFFEEAANKKIIEKAQLPDENLNHLSTASRNKRERGKKAEMELSRE